MLDLTLNIHRDLSAERANAIVNDPSVRPWVGGSGYLDLAQSVANPSNYLLMGERGGALFVCLEPGLYEAHTFALPDGRGKEMIAVIKDALRYMFIRTDAVEIVTKVPDGNAGALGLVRAIHGQLQFTREHAWPLGDTTVSVGYYSLPIMFWAGKCEELSTSGEWFHHKLEHAKVNTPNAALLHEDDDAHDRYVGATCEMIASGQMNKGLNFYNRWARLAGYGPVCQIASNPIVYDIGDALIAVRGADFSVLLCR